MKKPPARCVLHLTEGRMEGTKAPKGFRSQGSQLLLADRDEPAPALVLTIVSPDEDRAAEREDTREAGNVVRVQPRGVGETDRSLAVGVGVGGLECLAPLPFGDLAVGYELLPHLIEVTAVAHLHELEPTGVLSLDHGALVLPVAGVSVPPHHCERLVLRVIAVECELEDGG